MDFKVLGRIMYRLYLSLQVCTGIKESKFTTCRTVTRVDVNIGDWILPKVHHRLWVRMFSHSF